MAYKKGGGREEEIEGKEERRKGKVETERGKTKGKEGIKEKRKGKEERKERKQEKRQEELKAKERANLANATGWPPLPFHRSVAPSLPTQSAAASGSCRPGIGRRRHGGARRGEARAGGARGARIGIGGGAGGAAPVAAAGRPLGRPAGEAAAFPGCCPLHLAQVACSWPRRLQAVPGEEIRAFAGIKKGFSFATLYRF